MRPGTLASTMLAIALSVTGLALAAGTIRPVAVATTIVRRAWFLADLARLDALVTRAAAREHGNLDTDGNEFRISWSDSGASVHVDGAEHRVSHLRVDSVERVVDPVPLIHVKVFDPYDRETTRWHLIAPLGRGNAP